MTDSSCPYGDPHCPCDDGESACHYEWAGDTKPWPAPKRLQRRPGCVQCDAEKTDFFPPHTASNRCESGRRPHCTCDTCF